MSHSAKKWQILPPAKKQSSADREERKQPCCLRKGKGLQLRAKEFVFINSFHQLSSEWLASHSRSCLASARSVAAPRPLQALTQLRSDDHFLRGSGLFDRFLHLHEKQGRFAALIDEAARTFALKVRGDSMINAGIHAGDVVILEFEKEPKNRGIVAALIDENSTLKRYVVQNDRRPRD